MLTDALYSVPCSLASGGDLSFRSTCLRRMEIAITGVPPTNGYTVVYSRCCRNEVDNLTDASNSEGLLYLATMFPFESRQMYPCYDSSPQFVETLASVGCSGSELRYYSALGVDRDLIHSSYVFVPALGEMEYLSRIVPDIHSMFVAGSDVKSVMMQWNGIQRMR